MRALERDEVFDSVLPDALAVHGDLAGRGVAYKQLPPVGLHVDGRAVTLHGPAVRSRSPRGSTAAGVVAEMTADALSDLVQDSQSTMGLAMTARVKITEGTINDWIGWEPALRALLDGRKVHETGDVDVRRPRWAAARPRSHLHHRRRPRGDGELPRTGGFLHIRGVFDETEMAALGADIDEWIAKATPDDGESWWAMDDRGVSQAVRVLFFYEKSAALRVAGERRPVPADRRADR